MNKNEIKLYVMPKPECAPYLSELEDGIVTGGFNIEEFYIVKDWEGLSRVVYRDQLKSPDPNFIAGFENHVKLSRYLYGNRSCILIVDQTKIHSLQDKCIELHKIKDKFRQKLSKSLDGTFFLAVNTDRMSDGRFICGKRGTIGVSDYQKFVPIGKCLYGTWDYFYFKYIHCPDPDLDTVRKEWVILNENCIIGEKNKISRKEWNEMKKLKTFTPIREVV